MKKHAKGKVTVDVNVKDIAARAMKSSQKFHFFEKPKESHGKEQYCKSGPRTEYVFT